MLIDSHCHLNLLDKSFLDVAIKNAFNGGVSLIQNVCTTLAEFPRILEVANLDDRIFCSVGVHPCNTKEESNFCYEDLINFASNKKVIAFGETGLDYYHPDFDKDLQREKFILHIKAARKMNKTVIVHTRAADDDTVDLIAREKDIGDFKCLIHCFTGGVEFLRKLLDLGCFISYSGIVTFKNARDVFASMMETPVNRMLVETDAPYLAPVPVRGSSNEPFNVKYVAEFIAQNRGLFYKDFLDITEKTFRNLFCI